MRYEKPELVKLWEEHPGMPRCCFTCARFCNPGCSEYGPVPESFAGSLDACHDWRDADGVPF